jgi:hypothetical protein
MRPITPDACTIELDVSEAPDALLAAGNFIDLLEGFDKTPLWLPAAAAYRDCGS